MSKQQTVGKPIILLYQKYLVSKRSNKMAEESSTEVFVYTEGVIVPDDVVRVRIHPSVTVIPAGLFQQNIHLEEVELCEGLLEIGHNVFNGCTSLKHINIPSTLTKVGWYAFWKCRNLEELELPRGLRIVGVRAFSETNIKRFKVPSTVRRIELFAFENCRKLQQVELSEGLQFIGSHVFENCALLKHITIPNTVTCIGEKAFYGCKSFRKFRAPILTAIPPKAVCVCTGMFSVELPEDVVRVKEAAFALCTSLRNIAISSDTIIEELVFGGCTSLQQLFDTEINITNALKHRFDNLPIHKMIYYQSYNNVTVDQLNNATNMRSGQRRSLRSKLDPTGSQRDCLGMTPLHILACSTFQNIELYRVLIKKYPENLITKDRWGALPLLYAMWGDAPDEILQIFVESYRSLYPDYQLDWTEMLETLSKTKALDSIQKLLDLHGTSFPDRTLDLNSLLDELKSRNVSRGQERDDSDGTTINGRSVSECIFRCLVKHSLAERISAIGPRQWRGALINLIDNDSFLFAFYDHRNGTPKGWYDHFTSELSEHETRYQELKEATAMIELALWKNKMSDHCQERNEKRRIKKMKVEESAIRVECRVNCGANIVIEHALPFLIG